ncbi:MAG: hypothetical protein V2I48_11115 [Xanthomonadales bacterium]|jgi:hypothetical protein|nr:hypothetical protein [Xanthomonadales bacterium]
MTETTAKGSLKPRPGDVESPDAIIKALYEALSGPAGKRNFQRLRSLYFEGARLIPIGHRIHAEGNTHVMSVNEWIDDIAGYFEENAFFIEEIQRHADRFGDMIQVFSTYQAGESPDAEKKVRGIRAMQLLHREDRWWIVNVMWDNETRQNPLPGEFTPYLW